MDTSPRFELLAPAKDLACGLAAINCGADAVYIGASRFGARKEAGNPVEDIATLINHAHKYRARVYATLNTLLRDSDLPKAVELAWQLRGVGIDGLIIQDVGLLESTLPPLPLIASTQMHNSTPEKVAFLEQAGFVRAILARELTLNEIRAIRAAAPNIELEFFIHGALCVCYSGQCFLSYAIGGRSGNRGQCAQPCRKMYRLEDANGRVLDKGHHLLSIRDLNLSDHLDELIDAGITSFKIEGRLKDEAYVANTVAYYRNRLDRVLTPRGLHKVSSGTSTVSFTPNLDKVFNRGFTTYFLRGRSERIGSHASPKMVGEQVGPVTNVDGNTITLNTKLQLHPGDGLCLFDANKQLCGTLVNKADGKTIVVAKSDGFAPGAMVYRNLDHAFQAQLRKAKMERKLDVALSLSETSLQAVDEDGVTAELAIKEEFPVAQNPDEALATIKRQLAKTGGSEFNCIRVDVDLQRPRFIPVSALNAMRREVLAALMDARLKTPTNEFVGATKGTAGTPKTAGMASSCNPDADATLGPSPRMRGDRGGCTFLCLNKKAKAFCERHGLEIEEAPESGIDMLGQKVMTTRYCLKYELGQCPKSVAPTNATVAPTNSFGGVSTGPLYLVDKDGTKLELRFNCATCHMEIYLQLREGL